MKAEELILRRTYFTCGYFFRHRPIPETESWIYVGVRPRKRRNVAPLSNPVSFHAKEWLAEASDDDDRAAPEERQIRVRLEDIEMVYSLSELEEFVTTIKNDPHAKDTF
jgi:hypothetical protein